MLWWSVFFRSSHRRCSTKKAVRKNHAIFTEKYLCWCLLLIKLFSCEYFGIFKNTYFEEHLRTAASSFSFIVTHVRPIFSPWRNQLSIFSNIMLIYRSLFSSCFLYSAKQLMNCGAKNKVALEYIITEVCHMTKNFLIH